MAYIEGISLGTGTGTVIKQVNGINGLTIETDLNLSITVRNSRGRGITGATVTIANPTSGIPSSAITDSNGNAYVNNDLTVSNTITVTKGKLSKSVSWTSGGTKTIVFDNSKPPDR